MKDFWLSCGHHLLDRDVGGGLLLTDDFIKVYLARPELVPPAEACAAERGLHARCSPTLAGRWHRAKLRPSPTRTRARIGKCCSHSATNC